MRSLLAFAMRLVRGDPWASCINPNSFYARPCCDADTDYGARHALLDVHGTRVDRGGVMATCGLTAFSEGADEQRFCGQPVPRASDAAAHGAAPCVIVSLSYNNKFMFEAAVLAETACVVHTFDCTTTTAAPDTQLMRLQGEYPDRLRFSKLCAGAEDDAANGIATWRTIANLSASRGTGRRPAQLMVLRADIEGFEYVVLPQIAALRQLGQSVIVDGSRHVTALGPTSLTPLQITFEIHAVAHPGLKVPLQQAHAPFIWPNDRGSGFLPKPWNATISATLSRLEDVGYRLVDRHDSPYCQHCTKLLVVDATVFAENRAENSYSLGDRFDMPKYNVGGWNVHSPPLIRNRVKIADALPNSLLSRYRAVEATLPQVNCSSFGAPHELCPGYPSIPLLRELLDMHGRDRGRTPHAFEALHRRDDTLLVHVRAGDMSPNFAALAEVREFVRTERFRFVRLLGAAHSDERHGKQRHYAHRYLTVLAGLINDLGVCRTSYHVSTSADDDLYQIYISKHVFVTIGGFSMLGSLVATGSVYVTPHYMHSKSESYVRALNDGSRKVFCVRSGRRTNPHNCSDFAAKTEDEKER